jgi:hypothetical protein
MDDGPSCLATPLCRVAVSLNEPFNARWRGAARPT